MASYPFVEFVRATFVLAGALAMIVGGFIVVPGWGSGGPPVIERGGILFPLQGAAFVMAGLTLFGFAGLLGLLVDIVFELRTLNAKRS